MALVYCRNCGSEVRGKFCTKCGTPVPQDTGNAPSSDAGATTVIRAEDLLKMESLNSDASGTVQMPTPNWDGGDQSAGTSSWPGQQPSQPSEPAWGSDPASQQWQGTTSGDTSGQGWQQNTPQYGATSGPSYGETSGPSYEQTGGAAYGQTGGPSYGQSGGTGYGVASTPYSSSTGPISIDIGSLMSGAIEIVQSRIQDVAVIAGVFAVLYAIEQVIGRISPALGLIGAIIGLVAYAVADTAYIFITDEGANGRTPAVEILNRVTPFIAPVAAALFIMGVCVVIGVIGIIVGMLIVATFLAVVPQAVVLGNSGVFGSLGQSFSLVSKNGGFGAAIAGILLYIVALIVVEVILTIFLHSIPILRDLVFGVVFGFLLAWYIGYTTLLYKGLRARAGSQNMVGAGTATF